MVWTDMESGVVYAGQCKVVEAGTDGNGNSTSYYLQGHN